MNDFIRIVRYAKPKFAPVNKLTEFNRGWISGLIDGDGSIHMGLSLGNWDIYVAISNTNLRMLEFLSDMIGQGFVVLKSEKTDKHKAIFEYRLKARNALRDLLPLLKLYDKDGQRKLVVEALDLLLKKELDILSPSGEQRLFALEAEVKQLNKRGPK